MRQRSRILLIVRGQTRWTERDVGFLKYVLNPVLLESIAQ